ncbi:uncharacterized protein zgc:194930 [Boleophthalmus pectinirostris]|uniref:uncharacterized protein zgc:194930 n=1 Tax=Boleophthalmus pectinirostris TaxID=150288 RepID=UPI00242E5CA9|nr:uncharacterized protein zgc:194930 [Boleophthalmus pectinirostris]
MGCQCCRMIKSYIYDPSVTVDGRKNDPAISSLYQPHHLSGAPPGGDPRHGKHKQGIHNPGFSKYNDSTLKLESDNNHVNHRLHSVPFKEVHRQASAPPAEGDLYIIQPDAPGPRWIMQEQPSQVPVYPEIQSYENQMDYNDRQGRSGWSGSHTEFRTESLSADEIDEGVGGTPEYPCDTGDEGSVLSVDIHTSTTSLSSADTKEDHKETKTPELSTVESGIVVSKSEDEEEEDREQPKNEAEEVASVTDSMVAEALAALEAATAGEEFE